MTSLGLIRRHLGARKLRTTLLLFSITVAFVILSLLSAFRNLTAADADASDPRLLIINRVSYSQPLPLAYVERIRSLIGVAQASYSSWLIGYHQTRQQAVVGYAVDPATFLSFREREIQLPKDAWDRFTRERAGMVAGRATAEKYGWKVGDIVPIVVDNLPRRDLSKTWEFSVVGIYDGRNREDDTNAVFVQYQYINSQRLSRRDTVDIIWVVPRQPQAVQKVAAAIDDQFRNSAFETQTSSYSEFAQAFAAQLGDVAKVIAIVSAAAAAALLLIMTNTLIVVFRERARDMAVLKAIGYSNLRIATLILSESIGLAVCGAGIGLMVAYQMAGALRKLGGVLFQNFYIGGAVAITALFGAICLGLVAAAIPAIAAVRMRPAAAMARL